MNIADMTPEEMLADKPVSMEVKEEILRRFERYLWLMVIKIMRYPRGRCMTREDWYQEAVIYLMKSADGWLPGKGAKFISYAMKGMWNGMRTELSRKNGLIRVSMWTLQNKPLQQFNVTLFTDVMREKRDVWCDIAEEMNRPIFSEDDCEKLHETMKCLNERDSHIMMLYWGHGLTVKNIGNKLGISTARVGQLLERSMQKMMERYGRRKRYRPQHRNTSNLPTAEKGARLCPT